MLVHQDFDCVGSRHTRLRCKPLTKPRKDVGAASAQRVRITLSLSGVSLTTRLNVLPALLLVGCIHFPPSIRLVAVEPQKDLLFHDVAVFTARSNESLQHQDVLVRAGSIVSIAPTTAALPRGARVIEGRGKTLLPGLIDVHAHPTGSGAPFYRLEYPDQERNLAAHLYVGVTTIYDPGGDPEELGKLSKRIESGELPGPRLIYAGRIITEKGGYPGVMIDQLLPWPVSRVASRRFSQEIATEDQAREAVQQNLAAGASFIKVAVTELPEHTPRLDAALIAAVVDAAHEAGKKVVAHVDSADDALLAARSGVDALWHDVQLDALAPAQAHEIAARVRTMAPTLSTFDGFDSLLDGTIHPSPLLRATESPQLVQSLIDAPNHVNEIPPDLKAWMERLHRNHQGRRDNVRALRAAGVTILAGTDANGADGSFPADIHDELVDLTQAGLSNADALLAATSRAARFMEDDPGYGTIEPGKSADLLLVNGDPLQDIHATAEIALVVSRGRVIDRGPGFAAH
jgi:imidazolonepropionase-like amidohydrolase